MTCKALTDILFDGDVAQGGYGARFAGVVFPGETLKANVWHGESGHRHGRGVRDDAAVLTGVELNPA